MKVVLISISDTFFDRIKLLKEYFESKNFEVIVITSDFSHRSKTKKNYEIADILIPTKEYYKNLSFKRLASHYDFSKKVKKEIDSIKPDCVYTIVPCNSIVKMMALYKKENPHTKLYVDLCDLWPETMPIKKIKNIFPFTVWRNFRDKYLIYADRVFTECHMFQAVLSKENDPKFVDLYWARSEKPLNSKPILKEDRMEFCYLGSINNIIDIDLIVSFLKECAKYKPTTLHVIGVGERKETLIEKALENEIYVMDHKEIYDQHEKQGVFDICNYSLNVLKPTVVVGLTMKSSDYMCGGIPMINTIQGDTQHLCNIENIGFNLNYDNVDIIAKKVCTLSLDEQMIQRENIKEVYLKYFTKESFFKVLDREGVGNE